MSNFIGIYNHTTGENILREMTAEEIAEREANNAAYLLRKADAEKAAIDERALKISAYQKLGLSDQEIEALLPTPEPLNRD
jgi:hypothetical protein